MKIAQARFEALLRKRSSRAINGALGLIIVLVVVQIWLLMASVESWLAGHMSVALPAAAVSGVLFAVAALLLRMALNAVKRNQPSGQP